MEWILVLSLVAFALVPFVYAWRCLFLGVEAIGADDWKPSELEWSTAALRRARSKRRRAEHELWDSEFAALGGGCSCHGARLSRRHY